MIVVGTGPLAFVLLNALCVVVVAVESLNEEIENPVVRVVVFVYENEVDRLVVKLIVTRLVVLLYGSDAAVLDGFPILYVDVVLVCVVEVIVVWLNDGAVCVTEEVGVASVLVRVKLSGGLTLISVRVNAVIKAETETKPEL